MLSCAKNKIGASLLLSLGFSLAILTAASLISNALIQTQKNVRNIEDVTMAFFSAEAGIEEALYYESFHKKGFEAHNIQDATFQNYTKFLGANASNANLNNSGFQWNIFARISNTTPNCPASNYDNTNEQCKGRIPFGKSAVINFSYDDNFNETEGRTDLALHDSANEKHPDPQGVVFSLFHERDSLNLDNSAPEKSSMAWIASYQNADGTEERLLPKHNKTAPLGGDIGDCSNAENINASTTGNYMCQNIVRDSNDSPLSFSIENTIKGFDESENEYSLVNDFYNTGVLWKNIKFLYLNIVTGNDDDADGKADHEPLDTMLYTITPTGNEMTATKTILRAKGRSRNIITDLETTIDNTQELTALDYGVLFE